MAKANQKTKQFLIYGCPQCKHISRLHFEAVDGESQEAGLVLRCGKCGLTIVSVRLYRDFYAEFIERQKAKHEAETRKRQKEKGVSHV